MVWDKEKMGQDKTTQEQNKKNKTAPEKKAVISEDTALGEIASDKIFEKDPELAKELAEDRKILERAQEYKEKKAKQAKHRKKNILIVLLVIALSAAGGTAYYMEQKKASEVSLTDITITDSQELVYAKITRIVGNDISVSLVTQGSSNSAQEMTGGKAVANGNASRSGNEQSSMAGSAESVPAMQSGTQENMAGEGGSKPSLQDAAGEGGSIPPVQNNATGGSSMPSIQGGAPGGGSMPSMQGSTQGNMAGAGASMISYTETGEDASYEIPVGTVVVTKLGTEATFSSLSAGKVIAIAVEKGTDVIDRIWIVQ